MANRIGSVCLSIGAGLMVSGVAAEMTANVTTTGKAAFVDLGGESITEIKGNRMRTEQVVRGQPQVTIIDIDNRRFVTLDAKKETAHVMPLDVVAEQFQKMGLEQVQASIEPTSQTKTIAGLPCTVHDLKASFPFSMTGQPQQGMDFTMLMSGTACLSTQAPGLEAYQRFYRNAADSGFVFGDPRATKSPAGAAQARAYTAMIKAMADAGMSLESRITMTASGTGPMAAMMSNLARSEITTTVTQVAASNLPAEAFDIPAGYKVKMQK